MDVVTAASEINGNVLLAAGLVGFLGLCYVVFMFAFKTTKFEDAFPPVKEREHAVASTDHQYNPKKDRRQQGKKKGKNGRNRSHETSDETPAQVAPEPTTVTTTTLTPPPPEPEPTAAELQVSSSEEQHPAGPGKKNKKKKAKRADDEVKKADPAIETVVEKREQPVVHSAAEEVASHHGENGKKNRNKKNATQPPVSTQPKRKATSIDEDALLERLREAVEPEYVTFVTKYFQQANNEKFDAANVKDELDAVTHRIREKEAAIAGLQKELAQARQNAVQRQSDNEKRLLLEVSKAQAALKEAEAQKGQIHVRLTTAETDNRQKLQQLQQSAFQAKQQLDLTLQQLAEVRVERDTLKQREGQVLNQLEQVKQDIVRLEEAKALVVTEKENIVQAASGPSDREIELEKQLEDLQRDNKLKQASIDTLNVELRKTFDEGHSTRQEVLDLRRSLAEEGEKLSTLTASLETAKAALNDTIAKHDDLQNILSDTKNALRSADLEKVDLKTQLREEREHVTQLEGQIVTAEQTTAAAVQSAERAEALQSQLSQAQNALAELKAASEAQDASTPQLEAYKTEVETLQGQLTSLKAEIADRDSQLDGLRLEIDGIKADYEGRLQSVKTDAQADLEALKSSSQAELASVKAAAAAQLEAANAAAAQATLEAAEATKAAALSAAAANVEEPIQLVRSNDLRSAPPTQNGDGEDYKQKYEDLFGVTEKLTANIKTAEDQVKTVLAQATAARKNVASAVADALKEAGITVKSANNLQDDQAVTGWSKSIKEAVQQNLDRQKAELAAAQAAAAAAKSEVPTSAPAPAPQSDVDIPTDSEEVAALREKISEYEEILEVLQDQIKSIEQAYEESLRHHGGSGGHHGRESSGHRRHRVSHSHASAE